MDEGNEVICSRYSSSDVFAEFNLQMQQNSD